MHYYISPRFSNEKLKDPSIDDLIDVFEDRVLNWIIRSSRNLLSVEHGEVGALALIMGYFEGVEMYVSGEDSKNRSREFFCRAFARVFDVKPSRPEIIQKVAEAMYAESRCGFAHDGMLRYKVFVSIDCPNAILFSWPKSNGEFDLERNYESIVINPQRFIDAVEKDFSKVIQRLRDKSDPELIKRFQVTVDARWGMNEAGPIVALNEEAFMIGRIS